MILKQLYKYRTFLEIMWYQSHLSWDSNHIPQPISKHMCRYTCIFLQEVFFKEHGIHSLIISGRPLPELDGTPDGTYGFCDQKGNWNDHSWILIDNKIIDLTLDQFGEDAISIVPYNHPKYNPSPDQKIFCKDFEKLGKRAKGWLEAYLARQES